MSGFSRLGLRIVVAAFALAALAAPLQQAWALAPKDALALLAERRTDNDLVEEADDAFQAGGYGALKAYLPRLQKVLDHAPKTMAQFLRDQPAVKDPSGSAVASLNAAFEDPGPDLYIEAAMLVGSYNVEMKLPKDAIKALDVGLRFEPDDLGLMNEKVLAMMQLHRNKEALAVVERMLTAPGLSVRDRSRLMRQKGFALVEMDRLDEGEAVYNEVLKISPGDSGSLHELEYIAMIRGGGRKTPMEVFNKNVPGSAPGP